MSSATAKTLVAITAIAAVTLLILSRRPQPTPPPIAVAESPAEGTAATPAPAPSADNSAELLKLRGRLAEERNVHPMLKVLATAPPAKLVVIAA
jgi:hypothetical protein